MFAAGSVSLKADPWDGDPPPFRDRIFFGGNFGLSFGSTTSIVLNPLMGYYITPRLAGGLGIRYEYFKYSYPGFVPYDTHIYGGTSFLRYTVIKNLADAIGLSGINYGLFLQGEYEILSLESQYFDPSPNAEDRFNLHTILVGGGVFMPIGNRSGFMIMVLWNLNESYNSIYNTNPIIRFGFNF
jgi:hypothetical protein